MLAFYLAIILLWIPHHKSNPPYWVLAAVAAACFALFAGRMNIFGLLAIALLLGLTYTVIWQKIPLILRILAGLAMLILPVGLAMRLVPGFQNLRLIDQIKLSPDALPYTIYLNIGKAFVGLILLGLLHQRIDRLIDWRTLLHKTFPIAFITTGVVLACLLILDYVRFDPKLPLLLLWWIPTNLLFVCVAEAAIWHC